MCQQQRCNKHPKTRCCTAPMTSVRRSLNCVYPSVRTISYYACPAGTRASILELVCTRSQTRTQRIALPYALLIPSAHDISAYMIPQVEYHSTAPFPPIQIKRSPRCTIDTFLPYEYIVRLGTPVPRSTSPRDQSAPKAS